MVKTGEVFTPSRPPKFTSVRRAKLWNTLELYAEQGGAFISVLGTTKLGKSTLVMEVMELAAFNDYIPGQDLVDGASALWSRLVAKLGIPSSSTTGKVSGDKSKWTIWARLGITAPFLSAGAGSTVAGEHHTDNSHGATYDMDAPSAVRDALKALADDAFSKGDYPPIIVIDDFHFVLSPEKRREIILALRPITESGVTVILATLPGREADEGFAGTNVGGRHYVVPVPRWNDSELREISTAGFKTLNVTASDTLVDCLIDESYGSPQLMQQLCFNLCRVENGVRHDKSDISDLKAPGDWTEFFLQVKDHQSVKWIQTLGVGLTQRKPRKAKAQLPDGRVLDGYQLILWALHELGSPAEVDFTKVRSKINELSTVREQGLSRFALEQKAKNMNVVASRDMQAALEKHSTRSDPEEEDTIADAEVFTDEELRLAERVPQPVFEVVGDKAVTMRVRILDPLLAYTLNWHPESFTSK